MDTYLAIDNGGTFIKYSVLSEDGVILRQGKEKTPGRDRSAEDYLRVLDKIMSWVNEDVRAICVSMPGRVDERRGVAQTAGSLSYFAGKNYRRILEERYSLPVSVENDGKCAALAELWKGNLQNVRCGAALVFGTGIGGGFILDGKIYRGAHFSAGEVNNMIFSPQSEFSRTSLLTASVSTLGLLYRASLAKGCDFHTLTGEQFFEWLEEGDPVIRGVFDTFVKQTASFLFSLQAVLVLEVITLGGGISKQAAFIDGVRSVYTAMYEDAIFKEVGGCSSVPARVVACAFDSDANMIGALYHHLTEKKPARV